MILLEAHTPDVTSQVTPLLSTHLVATVIVVGCMQFIERIVHHAQVAWEHHRDGIREWLRAALRHDVERYHHFVTDEQRAFHHSVFWAATSIVLYVSTVFRI